MGNAKPNTSAGVYTLPAGNGTKQKRTYNGKLAEVNDAVKVMDAAIAEENRNGNIHRMVVIWASYMASAYAVAVSVFEGTA